MPSDRIKARIAIYARYSSDLQRPTSIDDQFRTCVEHLERLGYDTTNVRYFRDEAISGKSAKADKREGFKQCVAEWSAGRFDVVAADEISRLARGPKELYGILEIIEKTGSRLFTADNLIDSEMPQFRLIFAIKGAMASESLNELAHRVRRAMLGQLERGYSLGPAPFGYRRVVEIGADGRRKGTRAEIVEEKAEVVRRIFLLRMEGKSLCAIAKELNNRGIPTIRKSRQGCDTFWRSSTVTNILGNPIYKGIVVWNGNDRRNGRIKRGKQIEEPMTFLRPELRLVSDDTWARCNSPGRLWRRGGGTCEFAGIVTCGACHRVLTVSHNRHNGGGSLYCMGCAHKAWVGAAQSHYGYMQVNGVRAIIRYVLERSCCESFIEEFKLRLKARLDSGVEGELDALKRELRRVEIARTRFLSLMECASGDDEEVIQRFRALDAERKSLERKVAETTERKRAINEDSIRRQIEVDPIPLLRKIFDEGIAPERLRAVIAQIFPRIVFCGKPSHRTAIVEVFISPGAAHAFACNSAVLESTAVRLRFLTSWDAKSRKWKVAQIDEDSESARKNVDDTRAGIDQPDSPEPSLADDDKRSELYVSLYMRRSHIDE